MSGIVNQVGARSGVIGSIEMDIESGTWTPVQGSKLVTTGTFNSVGTYTKINNHVWLIGRMWASGSSTTLECQNSAGSCMGLPFTIASSYEAPVTYTIGGRFVRLQTQVDTIAGCLHQT